MLDIIKVASYFLSRDSMRIKKLQKLCYYSQVWGLKNLGEKLFENPIEAWIDGPSVYEVHQLYKSFGRGLIPMEKCPEGISPAQLDILSSVFMWYGHYSEDELIWLSKREEAWMKSRGVTPAWEASRKEINEQLMVKTDLESRNVLLSRHHLPPVSFGFKLWDFDLKNNEDALGRGDWFQEILEAMADVTGRTKLDLETSGILTDKEDRRKALESLGFKFNKQYKFEYEIRELYLKSRACSIFGVFIDTVFYIVWFVSKQYRGPSIHIDERLNMALKEERKRSDDLKLFELEKEKEDLENRNRELWDLLDEMTDPKIKKYKQ